MLTDLQVRKLAPTGKGYTKYDAEGLFVHVAATGHRSWRVKYRFAGKEQRKTIGSYPKMSLSEARKSRDAFLKALETGRDPKLVARRAQLVGSKVGVSFEHYARQWHANQIPRWRPVHADDVIRSLERDLFPDLGDFAVDDIDKPLMLAVLRKVEGRGAIETAHRLRQRAEAIFNFASAEGLDNINPAASLGPVLKQKVVQQQWPSVRDIDGAREILSAVDSAGASPITRVASRILAITAQRPGMVRRMRWDDILNVDWALPPEQNAKATWRIRASDMKLEAKERADDNYDHHVHLPPKAVEALREIRAFTGTGEFVFWSGRSARKPMSENALSALYKRLGYKDRHVPHGWRSTFSTIMNTVVMSWTPLGGMTWRQIVDLMLAHQPVGMSATEFRYNQAHYAAQKLELANAWTNLLLEGAVPIERVISGPRRSLHR